MSHWKVHRDKIFTEIGLWANHPKLADSSPRTAIVSALNDAELSLNEAAMAEETKEYMDGNLKG